MKLLFTARKKLHIDENSKFSKNINEIENFISQPLTIWDNEEEHNILEKISNLQIEERRLFILYSLFDCSINRLAKFFDVDRKTIDSRINEIKKKIC